MKLNYKIDGIIKNINVPDSQNFTYGNSEILSNSRSDVTYKFDWYSEGFTIKNFIENNEFIEMKLGIENSIKNIISSSLKINVDEFSLENYHKFITNELDHIKVVSQTRDLFTKDFSFDINYLIPKLEKILNISITDYDEVNDYKSHIIVRINRPKSNDFNPPHKDIYEHYDGEGYVPKFVNFWIPICGVSNNSVLPICPKSHLIPEDKILRTKNGSIVNENNYRVRLIKSWDAKNELIRPIVKYGECLIFSPHLIHGLALNEEENTTRVALEFRLYEK
jgi:hypothetical protein